MLSARTVKIMPDAPAESSKMAAAESSPSTGCVDSPETCRVAERSWPVVSILDVSTFSELSLAGVFFFLA